MTDDLPFVTVIMPVRNEAQFLGRSLGAVLAQDYPPGRMEILVIDGDSDDETVSIARSVAADDPRARILRNPGRIVSRALNIGIDAARGEVIIRVDGHTVIAPDYVRQCVECLRATGADNVGGPQRFVGLTPMGRAIAVAYRSPFGVPSRFTTSRRAEYADTVYMGAWPRAVFERVGRFDESLAVNQDYEHSYRIRKAGGRVYLSLDIRSEYYGRQTLRGLWRQFFRYGEGKFAVLAKHPTSTRPRHLVAPAFVAALIGGAVVALSSRRIARLWRLTLVSYALANAAASIQAAQEHGWDHLPRLPLVFASMHLAWGTGFWRAALLRWREQVAHG